MMRVAFLVVVLALAAACGKSNSQPATGAAKPVAPADAQHQNVTGPHGDHSPHHGGLVMMNGDYHYEVVFDRGGKHHIWFSDAVREDLPASIASKVTMIVTRPHASPETLALAIDDSGESWIAAGQPVTGDDVMVKVSYSVKGDPFEVEIPFLIPVK